MPDATTLLHFRHFMEAHQLTQKIFAEIGSLLAEKKLSMCEGTIVDATIIAAPPSTRNAKRERNPEMHQTKKGNQWHFGLKAHLGVDADSGLAHPLSVMAAIQSDVSETHKLLHGEDKIVFLDGAFVGVEKRPVIARAHGHVQFEAAAKRGKIKAMAKGPFKRAMLALEQVKALRAGAGRALLANREEPLSASRDALPGIGDYKPSSPWPTWSSQNVSLRLPSRSKRHPLSRKSPMKTLLQLRHAEVSPPISLSNPNSKPTSKLKTGSTPQV